MIGQIFRKDWRLLWPLVTVTTLIQLGLECAQYSYGLFGGSASLPELTRLLTIAWYAAIAGTAIAVVQRDAMPSLEQDWLIRPLRRRDLLLAKMVFVLVAIVLPMLLLDFARAVTMGFSPSASLAAIALKELLVVAYVLIPVMAVAATTTGMTELLIFGAVLALVYAVTQGAATVLLGDGSCPTCDSSVKWIQHLWQHVAILLGAIVILGLQYYRRATSVSRVCALLGALVLALAQLPWNGAFALQRWLSPVPGAAARVSTALIPPASRAADATQVDPGPIGVAARPGALLHGKLQHADKYVRGLLHARAIPELVELPIQIAGLGEDELLHVDRAEMILSDEAGRQIYHGTAGNAPTVQGLAALPDGTRPAQAMLQAFDIPSARERLLTTAVRLEMHHSLTLMHVGARFTLAAVGGELHALDVGDCATRLNQEGDTIELNCLQLKAHPVCLSATLYGPQGERDPEVLKCNLDYRPFIPAPTNALTLYGIEVPVRDPEVHYAVDPDQLRRSYLRIKTFVVREHFTRSAVLPHVRLTDYVGHDLQLRGARASVKVSE